MTATATTTAGVTSSEFDPAKAEAFGGQLMGILGAGLLSLLQSGYKPVLTTQAVSTSGRCPGEDQRRSSTSLASGRRAGGRPAVAPAAAGGRGQPRGQPDVLSTVIRGRWAGFSCRRSADKFDQPQDHEQDNSDPDDHCGGGLAPEHKHQYRERGCTDSESLAVCVGPAAHRAGSHSHHLTAVAYPPESAGNGPAGTHSCDRRAAEERGGRHYQTQNQQCAKSSSDEPDECVEQNRGCVCWQLVVRHAVQVNAPEYQQSCRQHEHRCR